MLLDGLVVQAKVVVQNVLEMRLRCAIGQRAARGARNIAVHTQDRVVMGVGEVNALVMPSKIQVGHALGRNTVVKTMSWNVVTVRVVTHSPIPKDGAVAPRDSNGTNVRRIFQRCAALKNVVAITAARQLVDAIG